MLDRALIVPVLTAHPTEVMRKSMIDHRNRIAELMRLRDLGRDETRDGDVIEAGDPQADRTALADAAAAPRAALRRRRSGESRSPICATCSCRCCRRCTRDGNVICSASSAQLPAPRQLDRRRPRRQSQRHCGLAAPRAEERVADRAGDPISISCTRSAPSCRSPPSWPPRARRSRNSPTPAATSTRRGATSRTAARYRHLCPRSRPPTSGSPATRAARPPSSPAEPYSSAEDLRADLVAIAHSLGAERRRTARDRRRAGPADSRRRNLRLPSRHARSAPELPTSTRASSPIC